MPAWTTPLLRPVWCEPSVASFSSTVTDDPGARCSTSRATASPMIPPPTTTVEATGLQRVDGGLDGEGAAGLLDVQVLDHATVDGDDAAAVGLGLLEGGD